MADAVVKVTLPEMGESVTEGSIVEWRKRVGDQVNEGDTLVDVTTDKVDVEVPATAAGVITQLYGKEGDTIAVGATLAEIDTALSVKGEPLPSKATAADAAHLTNGKTTQAPEKKIVAVTLPEMGESVTEGSIVEFRVKPGQSVNEGDTIVDVTTDKVDVEVPATASGVVTQLFGKAGDTIAVGAKLAEIDVDSAKAESVTVGLRPIREVAPSAPEPVAPKPRSGEVAASHQARRIASKLELDLSSINGSGPNGLILRTDVTTQANGARKLAPASPKSALPSLPAPPAGAKLTPLKGPAAALTGYMEQSLTIPTATSFRTLPVDVLDARRKELNNAIKVANRSEKVSFTHLIAYALVRAA
ncbi:MAG TPA: biotin/lipoyl-containing protein, partial [Candidatus Aquilonibacter sp.]